MKKEIQQAIEVLKNGGCILYPTDTIWGIGCDATNPDAVSKVYGIKQREDSKAMLVLVSSIDMIWDFVEEIPEAAQEILEVNEQPLTIIYPGARTGGKGLAKNLIASDGSIGIRITNEPFSKALIEAFRKPLVSSSANIAGGKSPDNFPDISSEVRQGVDHIVNWKQDDMKKRKPSGILKVSLNGIIEIIRQ
jgi:L-threonylcarbamoyladenylate synthase